ncbi:hypothetical protein L3i20_v236010 [Paenibacillus sp. L3-i20]|nr:hypothetical protein L3i20_v236010 [Paenibacillus sp. L3-i20]
MENELHKKQGITPQNSRKKGRRLYMNNFSMKDQSQAKRLNIFEEELNRELQKWKRRASP